MAEKGQKPALALSLDKVARRGLSEVAQSIKACPEQWLGPNGLSFEPEAPDLFQMVFVYCTERLLNLPSESLQTLYDDLQKAVADVSAEGPSLSLTCRCLELYGPDRSHLIARFRAPASLMQLRRSMWRICREFGVAFPDAMWSPFVRLGRIRGPRCQLNQISFNKLPALSINATSLTLLGKRPHDSYCDCDWDALKFQFKPFNSEPIQDRKDGPMTAKAALALAATLGPRGCTAPTTEYIPTEESPISTSSTSASSNFRPATAPVPQTPTSANKGFVMELPKFRRPSGEPSLWKRPTGCRGRLAPPV